jgi:uncharacterized protein YjiS (DUF1127 family)
MSRTLDLARAIPDRSQSAGAVGITPGQLVAGALRKAVNAWMVRRAIESLQSLDDHTLKDIGMHRSEIESIVRRHMMPADEPGRAPC